MQPQPNRLIHENSPYLQQHAFELQQRYLAGNMEEYPINHSFSLLTFLNKS